MKSSNGKNPTRAVRSNAESPKQRGISLEQGAVYYEYWAAFKDYLVNHNTTLPVTDVKPIRKSWWLISMGKKDFRLMPAFIGGHGISAELLLPKWAFYEMLPSIDKIRKDTRVKWEWKTYGSGQWDTCICITNAKYDWTDKDQRLQQYRWMKKHLELLDKAFRHRIKRLSSA